TPYEWFEQIILGLLVFVIALIITYTLILSVITVGNDFSSGLKFMEVGALQDTFGHILTVIILVEFNHSIVLAIRQRSGAIQVRIIVLITIIVLARKLGLLDYAAESMETLLGLGGPSTRVPISSTCASSAERFCRQCPFSSPALNPAQSPAFRISSPSFVTSTTSPERA